jgi:hypothetical protein
MGDALRPSIVAGRPEYFLADAAVGGFVFYLCCLWRTTSTIVGEEVQGRD